MTAVPPRGPRRASIVSPLVMGDTAAHVVFTDEQDRRGVLIELRLDQGARPATVRRSFLSLFADVFGPGGPPQPVPVGRHYMRCALTPDEITRLVRGGDPATAAGAQRALGLIFHVWPDLILCGHLDRSISHFTFASSLLFDLSRSGGLAGDGSRVDGPLLATFSSADRAVGWWYPMASMLAGQDSESATDLVFRWGATGHDGYQQTPTPAAVVMQPQGKPYDFQPGAFYDLDANAVICANQSAFSGAHSDIRHPEVLWAVVSAAGLTV